MILKTDDEILEEYIDKYFSDIKGDVNREDVRKSYGFTDYLLNARLQDLRVAVIDSIQVIAERVKDGLHSRT